MLLRKLFIVTVLAFVVPTALLQFDAPVNAAAPGKPEEATGGKAYGLMVSLNEQVVRIPMMAEGKKIFLEGTVYRPNGPGPFPLVVLSHGSPRNAADRTKPRSRFIKASKTFVKRGFVVVIPMRRGYANSEGDYAEGYGRADHAYYYEAGLEGAKDLLAAVQFMAVQPYVDANRVLLVGQSAGGFASLALASQGFPGLLGVINFAGGRGSTMAGIASQPQIVAAMEKFGRTTRVPTLWIYAENDTFIPPDMARQMHAAFQRGDGQAQLVMLPPTGQEGHSVFSRNPGVWAPVVNDFLAQPGLKQPRRPEPPGR